MRYFITAERPTLLPAFLWLRSRARPVDAIYRRVREQADGLVSPPVSWSVFGASG
jgi:hypothetical protein